MNEKHYVGRHAGSFVKNTDSEKYTGLALLIDDNNEFRSGDQTGNVLEIECPYGTQAMADSILKSIQGKSFVGFEATDVELTPSAELGDGITTNGIYSVLANGTLTFGPGGFSDIAAPVDTELESEYHYESKQERSLNRKLARTRSLITKSSEEIKLLVEAVDGRVSALSVTVDGIDAEVTNAQNDIAALSMRADKIESRVKDAEGNISTLTQTAKGIQTRVESAEGAISKIEQFQDSITLSVSYNSSGTSGTIKLTADKDGKSEVLIASTNINFTGLVTFNSLKDSSSSTIIDGGLIKTGKVKAQFLELTGAITFSDLDESAQDAIYEANDNVEKLANGVYSGGTFINGTTIFSPTINANDMNIYPSNKVDIDGSFNIYGNWENAQHKAFSISYYGSEIPWITLDSWGEVRVTGGRWDFSDVVVYGISAQFG